MPLRPSLASRQESSASRRRRPSFRRSMAFLPRRDSSPAPPLPDSSCYSNTTTPLPASTSKILRISTPLEAGIPGPAAVSVPAPMPLTLKVPPIPTSSPPQRPTRPIRSASLAPGSGTGANDATPRLRKQSVTALKARRDSLPLTPSTPLIYEIAQAEAVPIRRFTKQGSGKKSLFREESSD